MKLAELKPKWWSNGSGRHGMGITFLCPHCKIQRLGVAFSNPIDLGKPGTIPTNSEQLGSKPTWFRSGKTFNDLTLNPSVDASKFGHWHGNITNGEIK